MTHSFPDAIAAQWNGQSRFARQSRISNRESRIKNSVCFREFRNSKNLVRSTEATGVSRFSRKKNVPATNRGNSEHSL